MIQLNSPSKGVCRITGSPRGVSVYSKKPLGEKDLLLISDPEDVPGKDILSWPGEYDVGGVTLRGIGHNEGKQVSWLAVVDGVRLAFPSTPLHDWTDEELQALGDVHVLVIPAEDAKKVQKLLEDLDPRILVLIEGEKGIDSEVLKICGAVGKEQVSEYKIKGSLPAEGREVVVLAS